jgi:uncharacterized protein
MKNLGTYTIVAWLVTFVLAYFGPGSYAGELIEGMDASMLPMGPNVVFLVSLVASVALSVVWARRDNPEQGRESTSRRKFLIGSAAVTGGVVGVAGATVSRVSGWATTTGPALALDGETKAPIAHESWKGARIKQYRELGSTGFKVSDISFGSTQFVTRHTDPVGYLNEALDRGVNYIDTSPDYAGARSETAIGEAIKGRNREEIFLATKWCTADGHVRQGESVQTYLDALNGSLERLGTDYVDLVHVHSCDTVERLMDPNVHEAFEIAKAEGKVRFLGVSTHTPNLEEVADAAIDSGKFDVMMLAYHHGAWPRQVDIIDRAAKAGMGIVAMKTLKGAKHKGMVDFREEADSYTQAAFKWVMSNPSVACLVVSFSDNQHLDEYLHASGKDLTNSDVAVLDHYDEMIAGTHCFAHCGDCLDSCPQSVPINDVLRHRMYFEDYGDQKQAMELYAKLDHQADSCINCSAPCTGACPQGINIKERMTGAHEKLTLMG